MQLRLRARSSASEGPNRLACHSTAPLLGDGCGAVAGAGLQRILRGGRGCEKEFERVYRVPTEHGSPETDKRVSSCRRVMWATMLEHVGMDSLCVGTGAPCKSYSEACCADDCCGMFGCDGNLTVASCSR